MALNGLLCFSMIWINAILTTRGISQTRMSEQVLNWEDLTPIYDAYINCPSSENAKALLNALPVNRPEKEIGSAERGLSHIFGGAHFPVMRSEVLAGDRLAVEIMFRFFNITDGTYSDTVETMLAGLVRSKPRLFVEVLSAYKNLDHLRRFGPPVDFVGEGYESHPCALKHEYEKRIEALEEIKDPIYAEVIEACIKKLRESIKQHVH